MGGVFDDWVEAFVCRVDGMGLAAPLALLLGAYRPLAFVASQFVLLGQPVLDLFVVHDDTSQLALLLQDRRRLDNLISRLAARDAREAG